MRPLSQRLRPPSRNPSTPRTCISRPGPEGLGALTVGTAVSGAGSGMGSQAKNQERAPIRSNLHHFFFPALPGPDFCFRIARLSGEPTAESRIETGFPAPLCKHLYTRIAPHPLIRKPIATFPKVRFCVRRSSKSDLGQMFSEAAVSSLRRQAVKAGASTPCLFPATNPRIKSRPNWRLGPKTPASSGKHNRNPLR
jgi:hypothetical protein